MSWKRSYWSNRANSTKSESGRQKRACRRKATNSSPRSGRDTLGCIVVDICISEL